MQSIRWSLAVVLAVATGAAAQQAASPEGTGSVSGHVTCADTQRPARFAAVTLYAVPANVKPAPKTPPDPKDMAALTAVMKSAMGGMNFVIGQTGLDGSFDITGVTPGDYYVFAAVPGYITPLNAVQAAVAAGADLSKPLPGIPMVHVTADHGSQTDITIDRGASVEGHVMWDDGSPVTQANVTVKSVKGDEKKNLPPQFAMLAVSSVRSGGLMATTDDQGRFRISGLAAGDYYVEASLQTHMQFGMQKGSMNFNGMLADKPLVIFAPAALHQADAKPVTLRAGQENRDLELTVNLNGLHTVSGTVSSMEDHHGLNSATVTLEDVKDKDFKRTAGVDALGHFTVTFVPAGTYNMTVTEAEDTEPAKTKKGGGGLFNFQSDKTLRSYKDGKASVIVTDSDVTGQDVALAVDPDAKDKPDMGAILGGILGGTPPPPSSAPKSIELGTPNQ